MSERRLVFHEDAATAIEEALSTAHDDLTEAIGTMRASVRSRLGEWTEESDSRQAQIDVDERLAARVSELARALDAARTAFVQLAEGAHDAEVHNVAVMD